MSIAAGSRIGPYEVVAALGAGAMGEVFRARDTRLHREVAIKILPATYSRDPDRLRRFEQEARAAALLSHPNILAVHDVGVHDDAPYIVSELLEGETLRARLARTPFLPRKAIECALQIAHGLAAAHAKGVVHRDLKPENIFLTADGGAKILDFGIAKLKGHVVADGGAETAAIGTEPGVLLGTAAYMAPEQVRGEPADHRSDIFSLGAVLYEMIGGQRPFRRKSAVETMNAILTEEPRRLIELVPAVPPALDWLVARCLEKDPGDRFQSTQDLAISLEFAASPLPPGAARPGDRRLRRRAVAAALLAAAVLFAAGMFATRFVGRTSSVAAPSEPTQSRLYRLTDFVGLEEFPAVSPDGRSVAFTADVNGRRQIWVKLMGGGPPLQLTRDPVDHRFPRWSADSSALVYFTTPVEGGLAGSLWEISALGGAPRRLTASLGGADVSPDGRRLALFRSAEGTVELVVADRDGSRPTVVARLESGYVYRTPRWSPDGRSLAFERTYFGSRDRVFVTSLDDGSPREVTGNEDGPLGGFAWARDGSAIVFSSARLSTISYLPIFHVWRMRLADGRVEQLTFDEASYTFPDIAPDGSVLASRLRRRSDVWRFPTGGDAAANVARGVRVTHQTGVVRTPSVSPDGSQLVYLSDAGGHSNLWVTNLKTGETGQITFERDPALLIGVPMWSPRAPEIAFYSLPPGGIGGYSIVNADGSNLRAVIKRGFWGCWSPDGRWLYYQDQEEPRHLKKIPAAGGAASVVRAERAFMPALSPDGRALYFALDAPNAEGSFDYEIRRAQPEDGPSRLLARIPAHRVPDGRFHPVMSPDGAWLALPLADGVTTNLWAVSTADGTFRALTDFGTRPTLITRRLSWSSDGRFIYAAVDEGDADVVLLQRSAAPR